MRLVGTLAVLVVGRDFAGRAELYLERHGLAVAPDRQRYLFAGRRHAHARRKLAGIDDVHIVVLEDHIARLDPGMRSGAVGYHLGDQRALGRT